MDAGPSRIRQLSSPADDVGKSPAQKRAKAGTACQACRTRKLGCSGGMPCSRCKQEEKECRYGELERRTPLTRVRMTELEEKVELHQALWNTLFPSYSLDKACQRAGEQGTVAVVNEVQLLFFQGGSVGVSNPPVHPKDQSHPASPSRPPTRNPSPGPDLSPAVLLHPPEGDPETYEWHEESSKQTHPQADAGMGSLSSSDQGVSYLGLSSGATFLNAIRRLSPKPIDEPSPLAAILATANADSGWYPGGSSFGTNMSRGFSIPAPGKVLPTPRLPPMMEVMPLVDSYFSYFHPLTPVVHEPTIRAQIMGALPISSKPGSEVLLYMIFAMGALDRKRSEDDNDGSRYYDTARQSLQRDMLEEGTLPLAQGLAIMANYLQRNNRPNAGYICLGWAIRMATALGLHTPVTSWRCSPLEKEMRIRVWWAITTLEAGCSVTFGRPVAISSGLLSTVPLPLNIEDEHLTVSSMLSPPSTDGVTLYTPLVTQARLAKVTCPVHDRILQAKPAPTVDQIKRYDERLLAAIGSLPPYMQSVSGQDGRYRLARSVQVWRARDFRAILYRPVLLAAAWDSTNRKELSPAVRQAIETCRALAYENLQDIGNFVASIVDRCRGSEWYTLFFAFQASLTLLLSVVWEPNHRSAAAWKAILTSTATWFRQIQSMRRLATSYAQILDNVVGVVPSPIALSGPDALAAVFGDSPSSWPSNQNQDQTQTQGALDVERYWLEIWGNEMAPPNLSFGSWDFLGTQNGNGFSFS